MGEIIIGLLAVAIGYLFCYMGNIAMRVMLPLIGFFMGVSAGAALVSQDGFLSTGFSWIVGLCVGLLFGLLAYFFYEVAVVLAFAGLGFAVASALLMCLNLDWNWLIAIAGIALGVVFGITAIFVRMPIVVLILVSSFWGAAVIIYGLMLMFNSASLGDFSNGLAWLQIRNTPGLYILWLFFGITGGINQLKLLSKEAAFTKAYWEKSKTLNDYVK